MDFDILVAIHPDLSRFSSSLWRARPSVRRGTVASHDVVRRSRGQGRRPGGMSAVGEQHAGPARPTG